jgi:hypothetical protein
MMNRVNARFALALTLVCLLHGPAGAQEERVYQSARAISGKEVRVAMFGRANGNECKALPIPEVRVNDPPKNGALVIRAATIVTSRYPNCPNLKVPAQVLFYQGRSDYVGPDSIGFTVTFENGRTQIHTLSITVAKDGPPTTPEAL